ncbi:hypothetical protein ABIC84_004997 [Mucilaginibacter sp. 3215]
MFTEKSNSHRYIEHRTEKLNEATQLIYLVNNKFKKGVSEQKFVLTAALYPKPESNRHSFRCALATSASLVPLC